MTMTITIVSMKPDRIGLVNSKLIPYSGVCSTTFIVQTPGLMISIH